ncbi:MAG TPA: histidine kinase, partial [Cytophagales bacterium]|nr:histidine kinase [Cytophagales bacterium]
RFNNVHIAERLAGVPGPRESLWQIILEMDLTLATYFFRLHLATAAFIVLKTFKDRMVQQREIETLKSEKATAELNFLKAQIHPHFLFNTLNNLYALTLDKSDQAPEVVAKLSEMLDYMLYKGQEDRVALRDEMAHLKNFTELEALRYGDRLQLTVDFEVPDPHATIAPLILISLVENAFKHGVSGATHKAVVQIKLAQQPKQLYFEVRNTKPRTAQPDPRGYREGIGVNNARRQLDLVYPDRHQWQVEATDEEYCVQLTIQT